MLNEENRAGGNRIYFLDNLRTFMIFLVVMIHSGLVYEKGVFSSFFWIVSDPATNNLVRDLRIISDIFIMPIIFFISGYLTPLSLRNKKGRLFIKSKFKRLIIPWIIAVLTLLPLYKLIFLFSRDLPQQDWTTYFHWSNRIWGQNWLWFLPVLFLFNSLYWLLSKIKMKLHISFKTAVTAIFLIGFIYSFCTDILKGQGWTKTILIDFQNERLLIYFMIFLLGSLCYKLKIFESKPKNTRLTISVICSVWIPIILYHHFYLNAVIRPGHFIFSHLIDTLLLWINYHLSLFGILYLMINTFRIYLDKQGKLTKELNNNSYQVYIIHTVLMGGLATILLHMILPSLLKFLFLTVSTFVISNILIYLYREIIQFKILKRGL